MVWVNLLPWRERQRAAQLRHSVTGLLVILLTGIMLLTMFYLQLAAENHRWQQQIAQRQLALAGADTLAQRLAEAQQQYQQLQARQQRQQHQQQRIQHWRQFVEALPQLMPERLWLTRFTQAMSGVQIAGVSQQLDDVDALRLQLLAQPLLQQVTTGNLQRLPDGGLQFSLHAVLQEDMSDE